MSKPKAGEIIPIDDSPDVAALVTRFQLEQEAALSATRQSYDKQLDKLRLAVAQQSETLRKQTAELESMRRIFTDLQDVSRKATSDMVLLLKDATAAATTAKESAQVYERMVDARPDLIRHIEATNANVANYRGEVKRYTDTVDNLSKTLDRVAGGVADYAVTKRAVESMSNAKLPPLAPPQKGKS